ncbi:hypothetical protein OIU78_024659 [Salix suchowensis]|nr:hypothetical protein OIU78_024659 [Salix suchowensis]
MGGETTSHISSASAIWCLWKIGWEGLWGVLRGSSISEGSQYFHNIWFSLDNEIQCENSEKPIKKNLRMILHPGKYSSHLCLLNLMEELATILTHCHRLRMVQNTAMFLPIVPQKIELHVVEVPSTINLDRPFLVIPVLFWVHLNLSNQTDRIVYFLEVWLSQDDTLDEKA